MVIVQSQQVSEALHRLFAVSLTCHTLAVAQSGVKLPPFCQNGFNVGLGRLSLLTYDSCARFSRDSRMKVQFGGQILTNSSQRPRGMVFVGGFKVSVYRLAADVQQVGEELTGLHSASTGSDTSKGNYRQIYDVKPGSGYGVKPEFEVSNPVTLGMKTTLKITETGAIHSRPGIHVFGAAIVTDQALVNGRAWIDGNAQVRDQACVHHRARVTGYAVIAQHATINSDAQVMDHAVVKGQAYVGDKVRVYGYATVMGSVTIYESVRIGGHAQVRGHAQVKGEVLLCGGTQVSGNAEIWGEAWIEGDTHVKGNARVYGNAQIRGDAVITGMARIGGTAEILGGVWDGSEGEITEGRWRAPGVPA